MYLTHFIILIYLLLFSVHQIVVHPVLNLQVALVLHHLHVQAVQVLIHLVLQVTMKGLDQKGGLHIFLIL